VSEQYKGEFGPDLNVHTLHSLAVVQVFAKALEKSGSSDLSALIDALK
jgi:ABC-type branched-subunit amino acid transport system substrate-binding protein